MMKKIFVFFVIFSIAATMSFAEFQFRTEMGFWSNVYGVVIPTGDNAKTLKQDPVTGDWEPNTGYASGSDKTLAWALPQKTFILLEDAQHGAYLPISQGFFLSAPVIPGGLSWAGGEFMRLKMLWNGDGIESYVSALLSNGYGGILNVMRRIVTNNTVGDNEQYSLPIENRVNPLNLNFIFGSLWIDEFWIKANTSMFTVYVGNQGNGGATGNYTFQDFDDYSSLTKVDGFGVFVPSPEGPLANPRNQGHRNLAQVEGNSWGQAVKGNWDTGISTFGITYMLGTIKLDRIAPSIPFPLNIDLGFDLGTGSNLFEVAAPQDNGQIRAGGGIRVSADKAFDLLNFDIMYKLRGGDPTTRNDYDEDWNPSGSHQPDGNGLMSHVVSAIFSLPPGIIPDLGISLGYTGFFRTHELQNIGPHNAVGDEPYRNIKTSSPVFTGIDLRMRYTGIQDFRITFNNNISFASAAASKYDEDGNLTARSYGIGNFYEFWGGNDSHIVPQYVSQSWIAVYNTLALRYLVSGRLQFFLEIGSQLGILTEKNVDPDRMGTPSIGGIDSWGTRTRMKHTMSGAIYASHQYNAKIRIQAGFSMFYENVNTKLSGFPEGELTEFAKTSFSSGGVGIAIPIRLSLTWE